jgi:hypothetical protein
MTYHVCNGRLYHSQTMLSDRIHSSLMKRKPMSVLKSHTISFERYTIMPVEPALPGKSQVRPKYSVPMYYMLHRTTCTPYHMYTVLYTFYTMGPAAFGLVPLPFTGEWSSLLFFSISLPLSLIADVSSPRRAPGSLWCTGHHREQLICPVFTCFRTASSASPLTCRLSI